MTPDPKEVERIAEGLSGPMRFALTRYARAYVWADGRSTKALVRRGLVIGVAHDPEMFGDIVLHTITQTGLAVRKHLKEQADAS